MLAMGFENPFDLAPTDDGNLWISEQGPGTHGAGRVTLRDLSGTSLVDADYDWLNPEGITLDHLGFLWVAEAYRDMGSMDSGQLVRVAPTGEVDIIAENMGIPVCAATAPDGSVYVSITGNRPRLVRLVIGD